MVSDFIALRPEIFLSCMALLILTIDVFLKESQRGFTYVLTQLSLVITGILSWQVIDTISPVVGLGDGRLFAFSGHFVVDKLSQLLKCGILSIVFLVVLYSRNYIQIRSLSQDADAHIARGEFHLLVLFSTLGMLVLVSAQTLLMLYLGLELLALPLYALVALKRNNAIAVEAAMKYFVMGALASGMLLYGMSLIYGLTHSLDILEIAGSLKLLSDGQLMMALFGLVFILAGFAFKLGLVPFHMWIPDVYHGAPTAVMLFIGTAPKIAAFGMAYRLFAQMMPSLSATWVSLFVLLAILSLMIGNIVAIAQTNIKRMLAYSTIAHVGFFILGFLAGPTAGYVSSLYYILIYALVGACGFGMLIYLSHQGFEAEKISDFQGLAKQRPWMAFMMLLVLFSLAGVPPTAGFYAKFLVLIALVDAGYVWLACFAVIFSVIGAYYYLRVIKTMYFDMPVERLRVNSKANDLAIGLSLNGIAILALGLFPGILLSLCRLVLV